MSTVAAPGEGPLSTRHLLARDFELARAVFNCSKPPLRIPFIDGHAALAWIPIRVRNSILKSMLDEDAHILKQSAPVVFVDSYDSKNGLVLDLQLPHPEGHAGEVQRDVIDEARRRLDDLGIGQNGQIVRKVPADTDPSRVVIS